MVMSSRSVIWTLTHHPMPTPAERLRRELAKEVKDALAKTDLTPHLRNAAATVDAATMFDADTGVPDRARPTGPEADPEPFLAALLNLDPEAGGRHRRGQRPVRQQVTPEFVASALAHWARNDGTGGRSGLLTGDVLDRLVGSGVLSPEAARQLGAGTARPTVLRDFCDDSKKGADLGLDARLANARKVCYGIFAPRFPDDSLEATDPARWHARCPDFWLRSDVIARASRQDKDH